MSRRELLGVAVMVLLVFGLTLALLLPKGELAPPPPDVVEVPEAPAAPPPRPLTWKEGARVVIPPPPSRAARTPTTLLDNDSARLAFAAVMPPMRACLVDWTVIDPNVAGHVLVELRLGAMGLVAADILDHDAAPPEVLDCLGDALYNADWPAPAEGEAIVKYPFTFLNVTSPPEEVPVEDEGAGEDQADD
ncbi:hypothetical protein L6R49_22955 [Myxococcota bacterium]|nr:hypothetical protein [Myxococcota bacterium]